MNVSRGLIYLWRRTALRQVQEAFVPAVIEDEPGTVGSVPTAEPEAAIVLDFVDGRRLRIFASASPALAVAALNADSDDRAHHSDLIACGIPN